MIDRIDVNCADYDKRTPLHLAVSEGHVQVVDFLLKKGAKITEDRWGNTPLNSIESKDGDEFNKINFHFYISKLIKN